MLHLVEVVQVTFTYSILDLLDLILHRFCFVVRGLYTSSEKVKHTRETELQAKASHQPIKIENRLNHVLKKGRSRIDHQYLIVCQVYTLPSIFQLVN